MKYLRMIAMGLVCAFMGFGNAPIAVASHSTSTNVAVIPSYTGYGSAGVIKPADYPTVTMTVLSAAAVHSASDLAAYDTVVLYQFCGVGGYSAVTGAVIDWLRTYNGKLIIWDSDSCNTDDHTGADYHWLAALGAQFDLFTPGQTGMHAGSLAFTAITHLGSPTPASPYYIDTKSLVKDTDAVGDVNVVNENTVAPVWCALLRGTNYLGDSGFAHMYSKVGGLIGAPEALIIYCGLDTDYMDHSSTGGEQLIKLFKLELLHGWGAFDSPEVVDLPCRQIGNLTLSPDTGYSDLGQLYIVTATASVQDLATGNAIPVPGAPINFAVISGPHAGTDGVGTTDASGQTTFSYTGTAPGTDIIQATASFGGTNYTATATEYWNDPNDIRLVKNSLLVGTNVMVGQSFDYEISFTTFSNTVTAVNLQVIDYLPTELDFVGVTTNGALSAVYDGAAHTVVWDFGSWPPLTAGPTNYLTVRVNAGATVGQTIVNLASMVCSNLPPFRTRERNPREVTTNSNCVVLIGSAIETNTVRVRQTGLFFQTVTLTNLCGAAVNGVRVSVEGLSNDVTVFNATGTSNGVPYVDYPASILGGQTGVLTVEYFVPNRLTIPTPTLTAVPLTGNAPVAPTGTSLEIARAIFTNSYFVVEFRSLSNRIYHIQYSADLVNWQTAIPSVQGNGSSVMWLDSGPPKTDSPPIGQTNRYYRVVLVP